MREPSSVSADGSYQVGALMDDALPVLDAAGPTGRDVVIGHDWGAMTAAGLAAVSDSPFTKSVIMSVPRSRRISPGAGPTLWRQWSPGYDEAEDVRLVAHAIGAPENWRAAISMYRQNFRGTKPPAEYADLHPLFMKSPVMPILYMHGDDNGCMAPDYIAWVERILLPAETPSWSRVRVISCNSSSRMWWGAISWTTSVESDQRA